MRPFYRHYLAYRNRGNDVTCNIRGRSCKRFGQFDHVRQYGTDYFSRLEASGFTVRRIKYDSEIALRYGFIPDEEIIVCIKPEKHGRVNVENC